MASRRGGGSLHRGIFYGPSSEQQLMGRHGLVSIRQQEDLLRRKKREIMDKLHQQEEGEKGPFSCDGISPASQKHLSVFDRPAPVIVPGPAKRPLLAIPMSHGQNVATDSIKLYTSEANVGSNVATASRGKRSDQFEEKPTSIANAFSNDGGFLERFKKITNPEVQSDSLHLSQNIKDNNLNKQSRDLLQGNFAASESTVSPPRFPGPGHVDQGYNVHRGPVSRAIPRKVGHDKDGFGNGQNDGGYLPDSRDDHNIQGFNTDRGRMAHIHTVGSNISNVSAQNQEWSWNMGRRGDSKVESSDVVKPTPTHIKILPMGEANVPFEFPDGPQKDLIDQLASYMSTCNEETVKYIYDNNNSNPKYWFIYTDQTREHMYFMWKLKHERIKHDKYRAGSSANQSYIGKEHVFGDGSSDGQTQIGSRDIPYQHVSPSSLDMTNPLSRCDGPYHDLSGGLKDGPCFDRNIRSNFGQIVEGNMDQSKDTNFGSICESHLVSQRAPIRDEHDFGYGEFHVNKWDVGPNGSGSGERSGHPNRDDQFGYSRIQNKEDESKNKASVEFLPSVRGMGEFRMSDGKITESMPMPYEQNLSEPLHHGGKRANHRDIGSDSRNRLVEKMDNPRSINLSEGQGNGDSFHPPQKRRRSRWDEVDSGIRTKDAQSHTDYSRVQDDARFQHDIVDDLRRKEQLNEQQHMQELYDKVKQQQAAAAVATSQPGGRQQRPTRHQYDSDEEIDSSLGTWEHQNRLKEMETTANRALELTAKGHGKHHISDFLPPEEMEKFLERVKCAKEGRTYEFSDYQEHKIKDDNIGFKMLQQAGWTAGTGLGSEQQGRVNPVDKGSTVGVLGLGTSAAATEIGADDDEFHTYRKRMMLAYKFRPNPLNNPRRPYY